MNLNFEILYILLLFFSGAITTGVFCYYSPRNKKAYSPSYIIYYSFIFGIINNVVIYISTKKNISDVFIVTKKEELKYPVIEFKEIYLLLMLLLVSIFLGIIGSYIKTHNGLFRDKICNEDPYFNLLDSIYISKDENSKIFQNSPISLTVISTGENFKGLLKAYQVHDSLVEFLIIDTDTSIGTYIRLKLDDFILDYDLEQGETIYQNNQLSVKKNKNFYFLIVFYVINISITTIMFILIRFIV